MILYASYRVIKDNKDFGKFIDLVIDFANNYETNEDYKQFCQSGTTSSENVRGRFDYWRNMIREL